MGVATTGRRSVVLVRGQPQGPFGLDAVRVSGLPTAVSVRNHRPDMGRRLRRPTARRAPSGWMTGGGAPGHRWTTLADDVVAHSGETRSGRLDRCRGSQPPAGAGSRRSWSRHGAIHLHSRGSRSRPRQGMSSARHGDPARRGSRPPPARRRLEAGRLQARRSVGAGPPRVSDLQRDPRGGAVSEGVLEPPRPIKGTSTSS